MNKFAIVAQSTQNQTDEFTFATFESAVNMQFTFDAIIRAHGREMIEKDGVAYKLSMRENFEITTLVRVQENDLKALRESLKEGMYIKGRYAVENRNEVFDVEISYNLEGNLFDAGVAFGNAKSLFARETEVMIETDDLDCLQQFLPVYQCEILQKTDMAKQIEGIGKMSMLTVGYQNVYDLFHLGFSVGIAKGVEITERPMQTYEESVRYHTAIENNEDGYKCDCAHNPNCQCEEEVSNE